MPVNFQQLQNVYQPQKPIPLPTQGSDQGGGLGGILKGISQLARGISSPNPRPAEQGGNAGTALQSQQINPNSPFDIGSLSNSSIQSPEGSLNSVLYNNATKAVGMREGDQTLNAYLQKANPNLDPRVTPWCAGFVGSVLNASGLQGTGSLAAKSYLKFGQPTNSPQKGDIVVFNDMTGRNDPAHGHVGFVDSLDPKTGRVMVVGGNQSNQVSVKAFPLSAVAGFRTAPTGQDIQGFAQQNKIQNPAQIANIPKQINMAQQTQQAPQQQPMQQAQPINYYQDPKAPRGLRNNNPGNIEKTGGTYGPEVDGKDPRFATYATPEQGLSAMSQLLDRHNGESLTKIISRYAPSHENNTKEYIKNMSKSVGVAADAPLDLSNPTVKAAVIKGIIQIENGKNPYSDEMINKVVSPQQQSNVQMSMNRNGNEPISKFINPREVNPPQIPKQELDDILKELDGGHDDYAQNTNNQRLG